MLEHSPLICSLQPGCAARSADWGPAAAGSSSYRLLGNGSSLDPPPSPCAAAQPGERDPCCFWSVPSTAENRADLCPFGCQCHHRAGTLNTWTGHTPCTALASCILRGGSTAWAPGAGGELPRVTVLEGSATSLPEEHCLTMCCSSSLPLPPL